MKESHFINEQTQTMKTKIFQPIKELASSISFIKDSFLHPKDRSSGFILKNKRMNTYQNNQSIANLAAPSLQGSPIYIPTNTFHHSNKISFMKTFIRKSGVFAIALLLANLFFAANVSGQTITLTQPAQLTAVISGGATICSGQSSPVTVAISGGTAPYYINGVQQTGSSPFTISVSPVSTTTYNNTNIIVTDSKSCGSSVSGSAVITVDPTSVGGTATATVGSVCSGSNTTITLAGSTGSIQWQQSTDNSNWTDITGENAASYTTANLTSATYYRAKVTSGTCSSAYSNAQQITITPNASVGTISGTSPVCIGTVQTFTVPVVLGGGNGSWSSSNTSIATVDPTSGVVTAVNTGLPPSTIITYTVTGGCGGTVSKTKVLVVLGNASVASVTGPATLCVNETQHYTAGGIVSGGGSGGWSSENPAIATVDASGNVTAMAAGTTNIKYSITNGCGGTASASESITVNEAPSITTQPSPQTVTYGAASVSYSVAATGTPAPTYQWQVDDGSGFVDLTGETSATLSVAHPTVAMSGYHYHVIATNSCSSVTSDNVSLTVNPLPVTVTVDPGQTKVYGDANPATYTYTSSPAVGSSLANGDVISFTGALSRTAGEDVGSYAIARNDLDNSNYSITYTPDNFAITPLAVTVTADPGQSKVYGDANPAAYTYTSSPVVGSALANGEVISFSGSLSRTAGEDVGSYAIAQNDLNNSNYSITYTADNFSITPLAVTVTADPGQSKVYGDANPAAYTYTSSPAVGSALANGEVISFSGSLSRTAGEDVGSYAIGKNDLNNSNYSITYAPDNFAITPLEVTVTADPGQTKEYGDIDPATYTYTSSPAVGSALANGEVISFTGSLSRTAGEDVGSYAIGKNDLNNSNYSITYASDNFAITPLTVTVTADPGQTKVYGATNPATYTYTSSPAVGSALANGAVISFSGSLSRAAGEDVGSYAIGQNDLNNSNYNIIYTPDNFAITPLAVTVTADPGQSKVYGDANPATYTYTSSPVVGSALANGEVISFTGALSRTAGEDVGSYAIAQNDLNNSNYSITYTADDFSITPLAVTVTADPGQSKVYGDADPATYTYTSSPAVGSSLPNGDVISFTGALGREPGEAAGTYAIGLNTLANSNYNPISYIGADFTITNIAISASADAAIVECAGGTTLLTVTASGGDGTLQYSLNGGAYQNSNIFTVDAAGSPYVVTVKDEDGFTMNTNSVTVTEKPSPQISLSSGAETTNQTICIGNNIDDIVYAVTGNIDGATVTGLPSGVTGSYDAGTNTFTISGMPAAPGIYPYTVTTTGPCVNVSMSGTIVVNDNSTISLSSTAGTDAQTVCIGTAMNNITYAIGGAATGAVVAGLPAGVTGVYGAGVFTISGSPSVSGTFNYTVTTLGPCDNPFMEGTIVVNGNSTLILSSTVETTSQTVCINNAITDITYLVDDGATGAHVTGLPAGVTGVYNAGVFTISGTPTGHGTFNYTVTTEGPCQQVSLDGTIVVNDDATITLSSAANTEAQTVCIDLPIYNITYTTGGGAASASISAGALPAGVTGSFDSNSGVFMITGTPTESGSFSYTITAIGPCVSASISGTINVNANSTIALSSAAETDAQTVCINNAISDISYSIGGGGTSASITNGSLPAGVTGSFNGGIFTISGTPTESGSFSYTVTTGGPCDNVSMSGTLMVEANSTIALASAAGTDAQAICIGNAITDINYTIGGGGTGASITAGSLPAGLTASYSGGAFLITGTPTESGTFNYTITTTGPCVNASVDGTLTVYPSPVVNAIE